jgi:sec-independent protein translocase protein TatC
MQSTINDAQTPPQPVESGMMSWMDHARELRDRLFRVCVAVFVGVIIGFGATQWNDNWLLTELIRHLAPNGVQIFSPAEIFTESIKLSVAIGVCLAMPVIVYQLLAFIVPALTDRERNIIYLILPFITICFIAGLAFGWFVTIPAAFNFLLNFGSSEMIEARPTLERFMSLLTRLLLLNGVLFELPVIVYAVIWLGAIERKTLTQYRRYSILVIVIISAIITPTGDPANLAFTAVPMYLLYELGLLLALVAPRKRTPHPGT